MRRGFVVISFFIDILLDERQIGVPDGWSTYEILEHLVVNDENLFRDP